MSERTRQHLGGAVDSASDAMEGLQSLTPHRDDREPALVELCVGTSLRVAPMEFLEAAVTIVRQAMVPASRKCGLTPSRARRLNVQSINRYGPLVTRPG